MIYKQITKYLIVTAISKDKNICNWFYENFPKTIKAMNPEHEKYYRLSFKVDKMETWEQTKEYINRVKEAYNNLIITITPITETINTMV
jgi:hypothetical protein